MLRNFDYNPQVTVSLLICQTIHREKVKGFKLCGSRDQSWEFTRLDKALSNEELPLSNHITVQCSATPSIESLILRIVRSRLICILDSYLDLSTAINTGT